MVHEYVVRVSSLIDYRYWVEIKIAPCGRLNDPFLHDENIYDPLAMSKPLRACPVCPSCGSKKFKRIRQIEGHVLVRCIKCGKCIQI